MNPERAVGIASDALIWLAARPEDLAAFLGWSGAEAGSLRASAADPEFLGFVLEFLLGSDERVLAFAAEHGLAPDAPARARAALPGGALPNWT